MRSFLHWVDERTGLRTAARRFLLDPIPGGASWRHVWVSVLVFVFGVQLVTGFFLLSHYSASSQTAWESVYYLQHQVPGGWLLRGLHNVAAQAFVVLLALHLMQMVIRRAYLAPREVNFLLLLLLLPLAIGLSVTGWLLPFDQKGYWAARVPLNILGVVPVLGPALQRLLIGGAEVGHHTLTRFLALHAFLLPTITGGVLALHWYLSRRHGPVPAPGNRPAQPWWPDQALRDSVACLAVLAVVLLVVLRPQLTGAGEPGVELLAPADPTGQYSAARPEWFMLFLFQFLKYFPGSAEIWGAVVIPSLILLVIALMPWIGRWRLGARFNTGFILVVGLGVILLTLRAMQLDRDDARFQAARQEADEFAARATALASSPEGIPPQGALAMVRHDPLIQGPQIFAQHCAICHRYDGHDGLGGQPTEPATASDLKGFASRAWLEGLLDPARITTTNYFGATKFAAGKMVRFVTRKLADLSAEEKQQLAKAIAAVSAEANLKSQRTLDQEQAALIEEGRQLIASGAVDCTDCHQFRKPDDTAIAPDLTGYGSREWMIGFVSNPGHPRFYGSRNDRMPAFGVEQSLDHRAIGLVVDWLRGEWYQPRPETSDNDVEH